jgi:hypothetical protein
MISEQVAAEERRSQRRHGPHPRDADAGARRDALVFEDADAGPRPRNDLRIGHGVSVVIDGVVNFHAGQVMLGNGSER